MRRKIIVLLVTLTVWGLLTGIAMAQVYIFANGGSTWSQGGAQWYIISNDGYCIYGRGPCGSSLWYLQWSWNHAGCGFDEWGRWDWPSSYELPYLGKIYAWIDSSTGTIYGADYVVTYNGASSYHVTVDQRAYAEAWAPVAINLYKPANLTLTDGWGARYACNGLSGYQVEFDEIKLEY